MGGYAPLGYDVKDRGLVIKPKETLNVKLIYDKFIEFKSLTKVLEFMKNTGIQTKSGCNFSKKTLRHILTTTLYKWYVSHQGTEYKGAWRDYLWKNVRKSPENLKKIPEERKQKTISNVCLKDLLRHKSCNCLVMPTYIYKNKRKYRYYACSNQLKTKTYKAERHKTVPAGEVDQYVSNLVRESLKTPEIWSLTIENLKKNLESTSKSLEIMHKTLIKLGRRYLLKSSLKSSKKLPKKFSKMFRSTTHFWAPLQKLVSGKGSSLANGKYELMHDLARWNKISEPYVRKILDLNLLSPKIHMAIMDGTFSRLCKLQNIICDIPLSGYD